MIYFFAQEGMVLRYNHEMPQWFYTMGFVVPAVFLLIMLFLLRKWEENKKKDYICLLVPLIILVENLFRYLCCK